MQVYLHKEENISVTWAGNPALGTLHECLQISHINFLQMAVDLCAYKLAYMFLWALQNPKPKEEIKSEANRSVAQADPQLTSKWHPGIPGAGGKSLGPSSQLEGSSVDSR